MAEDLTYLAPRRALVLDWTTGYVLALAVVTVFFCASFVAFSYGSVAPGISAFIPEFGLNAFPRIRVTMIMGGGGMAALPFFLLGTALFFGAGTYFSVTVSGSDKHFTEGQQWQMLPQVNMVNATAILCVVLAAGLLTGVRPRSNDEAPPMADRLTVMKPLLLYALAPALFFLILEWLTFPRIQNASLASVMSVAESIPVFVIFLGCAIWTNINRATKCVIVFLVLLMSLEGLLSARKLTTMMPFLAASMGLWVGERHRLVAACLAALTVWLYIAMLASFVPQIRGHVLYDPLSNTIAERVSIIDDVVDTISEMEVDDSQHGIFARFSPTQFSAHFISSYDNNYPGESLDKVFVVLVPRVLWPEKPIINPGKEFDTVWRDWDIFSSLAIGFPAEAYWNNGWTAVVFVSLYIGLMLGWFSRKWFLFRRDGWIHGGVFIMSPLLVKSALWAESNIVGAYVGGWVKYALIILAIDFSIRGYLYLVEHFRDSFDDPLPVDMTPRTI